MLVRYCVPGVVLKASFGPNDNTVNAVVLSSLLR